MSIINSFEAMLAKGQDGTLIRFGLAQAYMKEKQFDKAVEHFLKTLEHDPAYSAAFKLLGKTYVELNEEDKAIEIFSKGIDIAQSKGDIQAAKEMRVFLKRLQKHEAPEN
jgi:Tfp pilus assembly protein PilF